MGKKFDIISKIFIILLVICAIASAIFLYRKFTNKETMEIKTSNSKNVFSKDINWNYDEYTTYYELWSKDNKSYFVGKNKNDAEWNEILELDGHPVYLGNYNGKFYFDDDVEYNLFYIDSKEEKPSVQYILRGNKFDSSDANHLRYAYIYGDKLYYQIWENENKNYILTMSLTDDNINNSDKFLDVSNYYHWYMDTEKGKIYLVGDYGRIGIEEYDVNTKERKTLVDESMYYQLVEEAFGDGGFANGFLTFKNKNANDSVTYYVYDILEDKVYNLQELEQDDYFGPKVVRHNGYIYFCRNSELYIIKNGEYKLLYTFNFDENIVKTFNRLGDNSFYISDGNFDGKYYSIIDEEVKEIQESDIKDDILKIKATDGRTIELKNAYESSIFN